MRLSKTTGEILGVSSFIVRGTLLICQQAFGNFFVGKQINPGGLAFDRKRRTNDAVYPEFPTLVTRQAHQRSAYGSITCFAVKGMIL